MRHNTRKKLVAMVTTTACMGSAEPGLLVDTYHKLVASSVGELQCNTVRHFRK